MIVEIKQFAAKNFIKSFFFCIGLTLTIWRSYECFQKYLHENMSTRVTMVNNIETIVPSIVICDEGYNSRLVQSTRNIIKYYA